jgi:hypothetical protein
MKAVHIEVEGLALDGVIVSNVALLGHSKVGANALTVVAKCSQELFTGVSTASFGHSSFNIIIQIQMNCKDHPQSSTHKQTENQPALSADYHSRGLDVCHFCGLNYNVGARIPRIIVGCGHTFCTSCLAYFLRNQKIRCPICRKMLKGIDSVDKLPLNFNILYEAVTQDPLLASVNF